MSTLLQKLRALAANEAKATPGPWVQCLGPVRLGVGSANAVVERKNVFSKVTNEDLANATLIAESRNLLKAALALVEAQHEALEAIAAQLECPARNTTMSSHRRDGSVIISMDVREKARAALQLANKEQP